MCVFAPGDLQKAKRERDAEEEISHDGEQERAAAARLR